jgi:O-methyltransferase
MSMKVDQMLEIAARNQRIAEHVQQQHPGVRNVFCNDSLLTYDKMLTFRTDEKLKRVTDLVTADLDEIDTVLHQNIIWRIHVLIWGASHGLHLPGDFMEMGVYQGNMSYAIASYLDFQTVDKTWVLVDSWQGLRDEDKNQHTPNAYMYERYRQPGLVDLVRKRFAAFPNVRMAQGFVPEVLAQPGNCPERIAFLHIDLNSARAERAGLEAVFDRVVPGAVIIFDDYGRMDYRESHEAVNSFMAEHGHAVMELPTGQGMVIKH